MGGRMRVWVIGLLVMSLFWVGVLHANEDEEITDDTEFSDAPLNDNVTHPDWFKLSFLNLPEDLDEALEEGKKGIIVYFGQKRCAYCKALMERDFGREDIAAYTQKNFDVIPLDIWSDRLVTDMQQFVLSEKDLAVREKTNFTPSLIFYDDEGEEALRLRGFYPPYKFQAALEYVAEGHHRTETFRDYLDRGVSALSFEEEGGLNENSLFLPGVVSLSREQFAGDGPQVVFFERPLCHACDVLHTGVMGDETIIRKLATLDVSQVNMLADTPVITPAGAKLTSKEWAAELGLFHAPTLVFYDEWGDEIIRVDSVVQFYRLNSVLEYVVSEGYLDEPNFQRWRQYTGRVVEAPSVEF